MKGKHFAIAVLALILPALLPQVSFAQNNEAHLTTIRQKYSSAMEMLKHRLDPEYPAKDKIVIDIDEMWPGSGQHNGKLEIFSGLELSPEYDELLRFPVFARYTYNIGGMNFYYEVLYLDEDDGKPETNKPIFFYAKIKDYSGNNHECRYYWWKEKLIKTITSDSYDGFPSADQALQRAKTIFQIATMNKLWNN